MHVSEFRLIIDPPLSGAQNMAIDEALLLDANEGGIATLRFYSWSKPTLSLGYFQHYNDRYSHAASRDCSIVRRPSGGGAILHDRELTYSLSIPASHASSRHSEQLYTAVHEAFIAELSHRLNAANSPWRVVRHDRRSTLPSSDEAFLCFQRRAQGDVLLLPTNTDDEVRLADAAESLLSIKILGSAQRRYRGAILQHGSLLLEKSPYAPELIGVRDKTDIDILSSDLIGGLTVRLADAFSVPNFVSRTLSRERQSKADQLANTKYGAAAWTNRR